MSAILPGSSTEGPHPVEDRLLGGATPVVERDLRLILDHVPALVNTVTPTGEIDFANRQLLDYLGVTLEQLHDLQPFIHEADRAMVIERWTHSIESGQPFGADYRLRRSDGVYRWFHGQGLPTHAPAGSIVRCWPDGRHRRAEAGRRSSAREGAARDPRQHSGPGRDPHSVGRARAVQPRRSRVPRRLRRRSEAVEDHRCHPSRRLAVAPPGTQARGANAPAVRHRAAHAARGWHVSIFSGAGGPGRRLRRHVSLVQRSNRHPRQKNSRGCVAAKRGISARSAAAQPHWRLALRSSNGCCRELAGDSAGVRRSARRGHLATVILVRQDSPGGPSSCSSAVRAVPGKTTDYRAGYRIVLPDGSIRYQCDKPSITTMPAFWFSSSVRQWT